MKISFEEEVMQASFYSQLFSKHQFAATNWFLRYNHV